MATTYVTSSLISYQQNDQIFGGTMTGANWSSIRNSGTSTEGLFLTGSSAGIKAFGNTSMKEYRASGRGGDVGSIGRLYLYFNTGSEVPSGATITDLTLQLYGSDQGGSSNDTIVVQGKTVLTNDFDGLFLTVPYSSELTTWNSGSFTDYSLNATAVSDFNTDQELYCAVIGYDHDYSDSLPSDPTDNYWSAIFLSTLNTQVPRLFITYTPAGWTKDIMGVSNASIVSVIGVAKASIANVIGV
jgi:hypothetical protein